MIEVVTAGLDWLTITLSTDAVSDQEFINKGLLCLDKIVDEGYQLEYRSLLGYEGVGANGSFVGSRKDTHMIVFSGRHANMFFSEVYRPDAHISRLDAQVTCKFRSMPKKVAREAYRDATTENETLSVGRRRKIWLIVGSDGGDTAYIGSASSDARGRIYNKEVQSEDPVYTKCWRYEVMLRNGQATTLARSVQTRFGDRTQFLSDYVAIWFEKRGIQIPWTYDETLVPVPPEKTLPTDVERKLNWLAHQVKPTCQFLLTVTDKGTILELLGLS